MSGPELHPAEEGTSTELAKLDAGSLAILNRSEIEQQVSTAKMYPRSIKHFRNEAMEMVTLTEKIAEECIYAVPRAGKTIEGPSARFAEIIVSAWGNVRAGARIISEDTENITAQGFFFDVERNVTIALEIKRRITDRQGRRYNADMISTTGNAAASIAFRNAVLKGIPKAFWTDMYDAARKTAIGNVQTLANKRAEMVAYFQKMGVTLEMICATLEVAGVEDIGLDELAKLKGMASALREGDSTPEQLFRMPEKEEKGEKGIAGLKETVRRGRPPSVKKEEPAKPQEKPVVEKAASAETLGIEKKEGEAEKTASQEAPGATISKPPEVQGGLISQISAVLRACKNPTELDQAWKREVEAGGISEIDKKKLSFVYGEVAARLRTSS